MTKLVNFTNTLVNFTRLFFTGLKGVTKISEFHQQFASLDPLSLHGLTIIFSIVDFTRSLNLKISEGND